MDNYIVINGIQIPLTKDQVKWIKYSVESYRKNPFERADIGEDYYFIASDGVTELNTENQTCLDDRAFKVANYCTDEKLMEQRALHETLNRLLWRFSMEHGETERKWDGPDRHYYIQANVASDHPHFEIVWSTGIKTNGVNYFPSRELAERAITEIIEPFVKEHLDFAW